MGFLDIVIGLPVPEERFQIDQVHSVVFLAAVSLHFSIDGRNIISLGRQGLVVPYQSQRVFSVTGVEIRYIALVERVGGLFISVYKSLYCFFRLSLGGVNPETGHHGSLVRAGFLLKLVRKGQGLVLHSPWNVKVDQAEVRLAL